MGKVILVPMELGVILKANKSEYGKYSLKSAFVGQEKSAFWKVLIIAFVFFGIAGLLSAYKTFLCMYCFCAHKIV